MNISFLGGLLQTISDRGRALIDRARAGRGHPELHSDNLVDMCVVLLSGRGEASGVTLARNILKCYSELTTGSRIAFFEALAHKFGPNQMRLRAAIAKWQENPSDGAAAEVQSASEPLRQELLRRLNLAHGGTAGLVRMREQLMDAMVHRPDLAVVDLDFVHLFSSWFNRGFLVLRRIDWATPANILEKIIRHEAVHTIRSWDDLRNRIDPQDRRCYAFFHPALVDEPLIFVEVALMREIAHVIDPILDVGREPLDVERATTAVFYSISNCQRGLAGVTFGHFLIKQVIEEITRDNPRLSIFVTLSPAPNFAEWLRDQRNTESSPVLAAGDRIALRILDESDWWQTPEKSELVRQPLINAAAWYFLHARNPRGTPFDAVARFHLGNGARLEQLNWLADTSSKAIQQSHGVMVNYLYDIEDIEKNHEAYVANRTIASSNALKRLVRAATRESTSFPPPNSAVSAQPAARAPTTNSNFFDFVASRIKSPSKIFLDTSAGVKMTYSDMLASSARLANALVKSGVLPGDRIAVQAEKTPECLLLYLATLRAGAVYLPLNTAYTHTELVYFLGDAKPTIVVCDPARRDDVLQIAKKQSIGVVETLDANGKGSIMQIAAKASKEFTEVSRAPGDLAAILYTSGTTGRSKGAMITHGNLSSNATALVAAWRFSESDVLLHALPIYHIHGLFVACNTILLAGGTMIFRPKFDAEDTIRLLPQVTSMMGVPTFYTRLLQHAKLTQEACKHMRLFTSGSAPLSPETHREFHLRTGHFILERYGMTETGMNTSNPYEGDRIAGTVGLPLPGIGLRITDSSTGKALPQGDVGMIEVKGPNVFSGYWCMPERTKAEFRDDGFFITGDVGKIDQQGYVHIVGREKDLIITGGFNVYPKEVENEINTLPDVIESAVIGCPHSDFGEGVTAVVVKRVGTKPVEQDILNALSGRLAKFKLPKRVIFVDDLPRNSMGKVQKNVLREHYGNLYD